jgi:hypothetical protein
MAFERTMLRHYGAGPMVRCWFGFHKFSLSDIHGGYSWCSAVLDFLLLRSVMSC